MYNYAGRPLAKAPGTSPDSTLDENHQRISLVIETELHLVQVIRVAPRSTRAGLMCALGVCSGTVFWVTASLAGLSAVIAARPSVLGALQLIGGLFCLYGCVLDSFRLYVRRAPTVVVDTEDYTEQTIAAGSINDMTGWRAYKL
ncbi:LysE family transporter, partial [uncultured Corynebacterium sp.]|uniref:LysE family translocator n=1 Tax=uncultured Corynebacterium sp. TaxID=159447 RepID=UPI00338FCC8E